MANYSTALADKILDHIMGTTSFTEPTVYVALFTTTPTMPAGTGGTEVATGSYARVEVTTKMAAASSGSAASNADLTFPTATADWGTIVGAGIYSASTSGTLYIAGPLSASKVVDNGDTFTLPSGDLVVALG